MLSMLRNDVLAKLLIKNMAKVTWQKVKLENACRIIHKDGYSYLTMPDGTVLPKQVFCRVTNIVNERPYAIVKVFVNLDDTIEEIGQHNQQYEEG